eukprot:CAMPEP_0176383688 /NCGR_PEP_ID=MMETSP0126-20121128/33710_1 /TAXON_ID=141414 ORGANISM="Strombidinopsis acuminatum, Strain SPMC142" /NCGR_SAMPLE_ID=MMETSP0126 /ASSEMBLY_ACC=CAM_ASM_000229 /LENGTH=65 /DNA_ID=CAMNT_0017748919 /DNA_START=116 /DNA_END=313 /DNA_ORIENTATION=+
MAYVVATVTARRTRFQGNETVTDLYVNDHGNGVLSDVSASPPVLNSGTVTFVMDDETSNGYDTYD